MAQSHEDRLHARICKLSSTIDNKDVYVYDSIIISYVCIMLNVCVRFEYETSRSDVCRIMFAKRKTHK